MSLPLSMCDITIYQGYYRIVEFKGKSGKNYVTKMRTLFHIVSTFPTRSFIHYIRIYMVIHSLYLCKQLFTLCNGIAIFTFDISEKSERNNVVTSHHVRKRLFVCDYPKVLHMYIVFSFYSLLLFCLFCFFGSFFCRKPHEKCITSHNSNILF